MEEKYILKPQKIAKECFLSEAIEWIAFNIYPLEGDDFQEMDNSNATVMLDLSIRRNESINDGIEAYFGDSYSGALDFKLNKDKCKILNLPTNPVFEYLAKYQDVVPSYLNEEEIEEYKEKDLEKYKLIKQYSLFEEAVENLEESAKDKLLKALEEGKIHSVGRPTTTMFEDTYFQINKYKTNGKFNPFEKISENIFKHIIEVEEDEEESIDTEENCLRGKEKGYIHILINFEELLKLFPAKEKEAKNISLSGGDFIISSKNYSEIIQQNIPHKKIASMGGKARAESYQQIKDFVKDEYSKLLLNKPKISNNEAVHKIIEKINSDFKSDNPLSEYSQIDTLRKWIAKIKMKS